MIGAVAPNRDLALVDVGGGAATLVDSLLEQGFTRLTVVDIAEAALAVARARLGPRGGAVRWIVADARHLELEQQVDLWHDRAVFHSLTATADQEAYLAALCRALRPGGHVLLATFGPNGPEKCSGLAVQRYDGDTLARRLGTAFEARRIVERRHVTPWGAPQDFTYGLFQRTG